VWTNFFWWGITKNLFWFLDAFLKMDCSNFWSTFRVFLFFIWRWNFLEHVNYFFFVTFLSDLGNLFLSVVVYWIWIQQKLSLVLQKKIFYGLSPYAPMINRFTAKVSIDFVQWVIFFKWRWMYFFMLYTQRWTHYPRLASLIFFLFEFYCGSSFSLKESSGIAKF